MSSRWYLLLSMSRWLYRWLYGHCLFLSHSSYLAVLLPPPVMLTLVPPGSVWIRVLCSLSYSVEILCPFYDLILMMDFSTPLVWSVCLRLASASAFFWLFLRLFDAMIVSRMIFWLYFLMSSLAFFLMVLHISAYSIHCLSSPVSTISHRFIIRTHVGYDILDFSGLLIA